MKQFKTDVMHWKDYDFTVINDKIEIMGVAGGLNSKAKNPIDRRSGPL